MTVIASEAGAPTLLSEPAAVARASDAFMLLKVIGSVVEAWKFLDVAGVAVDDSLVILEGGPSKFVETAATGLIWERKPDARTAL